MKSIKYLIAILVVAFAMIAFAGCGSSDEGDSGDHVFTVASSADTGGTLNPHLYTSDASLYALNLVYDPLVMYADGEIVPSLADEWNVSEDGLTYTFHIRGNAKFSDGSVCDKDGFLQSRRRQHV